MKSELYKTILQNLAMPIVLSVLWPVQSLHGEPVKIQVINRSGGAVECRVYRIETDGKMTSLGHTEGGKLTADSGCSNGCCLIFVPDERSTYFRDKADCPLRKNAFTLQRISGQDVQNLAARLTDSPKDKKEAAKFALIANEMARRVNSKTIKEAYSAEAMIQTSKFLDVDTPLVYDHVHKRFVATAELDDKVRSFQLKKGLKPTGVLDYSTIKQTAEVFDETHSLRNE